MSTPKTHLLRARPPWREGLDHTMCGRRVHDGDPPRSQPSAWARRSSTARPDDEMAAKARAWIRARYFAPSPPVLEGMCAICWERLGCYGIEKWHADPVKVLRIDLLVREGRGRKALRAEMAALASLAAEYPDRFRELLEAEQVMQALAGTGAGR